MARLPGARDTLNHPAPKEVRRLRARPGRARPSGGVAGGRTVLERRYAGIEHQNQSMAEMPAVFVPGWLVRNPQLAAGQKAPASALARWRYKKFIDRVARNFEQRTTLYDQRPPEIVVSPGDVAKPGTTSQQDAPGQ